MNWWYINYTSSKKEEKSPFEESVFDLINKIELLEKQYSLTLKLYESEYKKEIKSLKDKKNEALTQAEKIYNENFEEFSGTDREKHSFADYKSHYSDIDYHFSEFEEETEKKYNDFFDSYSKSILIMIYSLIESKLNYICGILKIEFNKKIGYEDLDSRDYLSTLIKYFKLVLEMDTDTVDSYISKLKDIQFIRNRIVHSDSILLEDSQNIIEKHKDELDLKNVENKTTIKIKHRKYILNKFDLIRDFFEELVWLIDENNNYKILKKGLRYWFGMLDENIEIQDVEVEKRNHNKNITFKLISNNIPELNCKIKIKRNASNSFSSIIQTEDETVNKFNEIVKQNSEFIFNYVFELLNLSKKGLNVEIMLY